MKLIEAMKQVKDLLVKADDISECCPKIDLDTKVCGECKETVK